MAQQQMEQSASFMNPPIIPTAQPAQVPYYQVPRTEAPPPPMGVMPTVGAAPSPMVHGQNMSEHGVGRSIHKEINFSIPDKANDCYKFDGQIANFEAWKAKMLNHMARGTQRYRTIILNCLKAKHPITMDDLKRTDINGFNAWEISVEVESFTSRFLNDSLFKDRLKLCNNEELNGLEMWRNLGIRFAGTGEQAVLTTGLQTFYEVYEVRG